MKYFLILIFLGISTGFAQEALDPLAKDKENYFKLLATKYVLIPHRGSYLLPIVYNTRPHEDIYSNIKKSLSGNYGNFYKKEETEFQISFMIPVERKVLGSNFDFNVAYTHHAWWQLYNKAYSRPFRETNYMPEMFFRYVDPSTSRIGGLDLMGADFGYVHQSNGQIQFLSRSWNRVYVKAMFQSHGFQFFTTAWYRIPEAIKDDENRDVYRYLGYGEFEVAKSIGGHTLNFKTPIGSRHLSIDLKYSYPWKENLRWYLSVQTGHGHSLIEYNRSTQRFGIGFVLDSFIDRSIH